MLVIMSIGTVAQAQEELEIEIKPGESIELKNIGTKSANLYAKNSYSDYCIKTNRYDNIFYDGAGNITGSGYQ